jgi:hypothetical protein
MDDRKVMYFSTPGYDFPSHQVVVIKTINGFIVAMPFLKWSYNVGTWSSDPQYWEGKLAKVLEVQDYSYEIEYVAKGLAEIDPEPQTRMVKERSYDEVKAKYVEFVESFLSGEVGTEKTELLPNLWAVVNKKRDFKASIECEYRVKDLRTMEKEWLAVVTHNDEKSNFILFE